MATILNLCPLPVNDRSLTNLTRPSRPSRFLTAVSTDARQYCELASCDAARPGIKALDTGQLARRYSLPRDCIAYVPSKMFFSTSNRFTYIQPMAMSRRGAHSLLPDSSSTPPSNSFVTKNYPCSITAALVTSMNGQARTQTMMSEASVSGVPGRYVQICTTILTRPFSTLG